mmetsp:Transcript_16142/g.22658  ORF Transcript_16142/g.22658 Transcript_16142/m.22658 type:complete len:97 (-) Transcript_16142:661-951(-)
MLHANKRAAQGWPPSFSNLPFNRNALEKVFNEGALHVLDHLLLLLVLKVEYVFNNREFRRSRVHPSESSPIVYHQASPYDIAAPIDSPCTNWDLQK